MLVTLMIIGVIASMTIPGLKNSAEERERIAQLKKAYSTVANATSMLETEYGPIKYWGFEMEENYASQFNLLKNCGDDSRDCFGADYSDSVKDLGGNRVGFGGMGSCLISADGAYWSVSLSEGCHIGSVCGGNLCGWFDVDVNGSKKPNVTGVDIFTFVLTKEGAFPCGSTQAGTFVKCGQSGYGQACTAKLIQDGKYSW